MAENNHTFLKSLVALLIATCAWAFVVYNYDPTTRVTYTNVPVTFIGEDTLADKGYGVVSASYESIYVELEQKRVETTKISADNISVIADVSSAVEGKNGITLDISGPDGTQVIDSEVRSISVDVERAERVEVDIAIQYRDTGETAAEPIATRLTSTKATVIGAKSLAENADKAIAYLDITDTNAGAGTFTRDLVAVDSSGEIIPHTVIYPGSVNFSASLGYTKSVNVNLKTTDESNDSYLRSTSNPVRINIKGAPDAIAAINSIDTENIDLTYIYEDTEIELKYVLPEGITLANGYGGETIKVTVTRKPEPEEEEDKSDTETSEDNKADHAN
ncbi:MAG: hypothetical protein IJI11_08735 [Mogibacterium sp.]|nr:hypothetical protein [Mogibacterium sp.]